MNKEELMQEINNLLSYKEEPALIKNKFWNGKIYGNVIYITEAGDRFGHIARGTKATAYKLTEQEKNELIYYINYNNWVANTLSFANSCYHKNKIDELENLMLFLKNGQTVTG